VGFNCAQHEVGFMLWTIEDQQGCTFLQHTKEGSLEGGVIVFDTGCRYQSSCTLYEKGELFINYSFYWFLMRILENLPLSSFS
jgi:hypothetical protein